MRTIVKSPKKHYCVSCNKCVYDSEQQLGVDFDLHQSCFYCQYEGCTMKLNIANYTQIDGKMYCPVHGKEVSSQSPKDSPRSPKKVMSPFAKPAVQQNGYPRKVYSSPISSIKKVGMEKDPKIILQLDKLCKLLDKGIITEKEFEEVKKKISA